MNINATNEIIKALKSHFIGIYKIPEVINYIDEITDIYIYKYENIEIRVYYRKKKDEINIQKIHKILKRAYKITDNCKNKLFMIHLIFSPAKKEFNYNEMITARNVNSGFTYTKGNEIFIFRREEYPKVIIHELLHHQQMIDQSHITSTKDKNELMKHFNINKDTILILNETIIELWALIMHLSFIADEYKLDINKLFEIETKYSIYKSYQILKLQETYKNQQWCDKCNIYAYIIFKMIIMTKIKDFFKIYSFPYDQTKIKDFIIKHSNQLFDLRKKKKEPVNPEFIINNQKFQRPIDSLCFMLLSDL